MASDDDRGRVLSIQSHVAYGYVGGKAATFPLQLLGYDVDGVNTVEFSNHSGYHRVGGTKATAEELERMFSVMEQNGLLRPKRVLTGFIFGAEALAVVAHTVSRLLRHDPQIVYLLDPVIGDAGSLYVSPDVIPVYRSLLPKASVITPNWFEVEVLTETKIEDAASLREALTILHETHSVPNVVISSIPMEQWLRDMTPPHIRSAVRDSERSLLCLASVRRTADRGGGSAPSRSPAPAPSTVHAACVPFIPGYFSGVGDLFSALVLGHYRTSPSGSASPPNGAVDHTVADSDGDDDDDDDDDGRVSPSLPHAVSLALTKTHAILRLTERYAYTLPPDERTATDDELDRKNPERRVRRMRGRELRLVQGRKILSGEATGELRLLREWEDFWR
ncbi:Ribokinase-like protein [Russula earlei]|uniref:Ribokinase-like protein n=1 Tax=Russula earlei TaxID=71964 RepID=A0ACC0U9B1_9AGAM|nr:Ribokinase-like protein [Russula earlei]